MLISGDVIRPSLSWLLTPGTVQILTAEMARSRDPEGFAELVSVCRKDPANTHTKNSALRRIATMMAAKGGMVRDITAGDCVEMAELLLGIGGGVDTSAYFYQLLHAMGVFPDAAPSTVRAVSGQAQGQISVEQMIDRYDIACRPVRDVLVDYLRERQPSLDFTSLRALSFGLGKLFWKDLETHHPGIDSLRLAPDVATAWKHRIATEDDPPQELRRAGRRGRVPALGPRDQLPGDGAGLLPRPRAVGDGRPDPLGGVGRPMPHPRRGDVAEKGPLPP